MLTRTRIAGSRLALLALLAAALLLVPAACGGGDTFTPYPSPTVTSVFPAAGFQTGGTGVTITGTNFVTGATQVEIAGVAATSVIVLGPTTITCTTGASPTTGAVAVRVTNARGTGTAAGAFTYVAYPPMPDPLGDQQIDADVTALTGVAPIVVCSAGTLYVAWIEDRGMQSQVWFNRSTDGGETWQATDTQISSAASVIFGLRLCADGSNVYAVWVQQPPAMTMDPIQLRMNASADGGLTWDAADVQVSQSAASLEQTNFHSICCSGSSLTVVWPSGSPVAQHFAQRTTDHGTTWLAADVQIGDAAAQGALAPAEICCDGLSVHATWVDLRNGDADVYYDRSTDGGATWGTDVRIDTAAGASTAAAPLISCTASRVHVAWLEDRNGMNAEVYANSSADAGASWGAADQVVSHVPAGTTFVFSPGLCCEGAHVYVTWSDNRNGTPEPFFNRSTDGGTTYGAASVRLDTGVMPGGAGMNPNLGLDGQRSSQICCEDGAIHVCWSDDRNGTLDVFLNASADAGATWLPADVRLDTDLPNAGNTVGGAPTICCAGPIAYVVWRDDRNNVGSGEGDIAFQRTVP